MATVMIKLRKVRNHEYALFGPKGNQISEIFRGNVFDAQDWAGRWVSGWYNWSIDSTEINDEKKDRIPNTPV